MIPDGDYYYNLPFFSEFNWYQADEDLYGFMNGYFGSRTGEKLYVSKIDYDYTEEHGIEYLATIFSIVTKFHGFTVPFTTIVRITKASYDALMEAEE